MTFLLRPLLTAVLLASLACTAVAAVAETAETVPFSNQYSSRVYGIGITATHELIPQGDDTWKMRFHATAWVGEIEEISTLRIEDDGQVVPLHYRYERSGLGRSRKGELTFDWEAGELIDNVKDERVEIDTSKNIQDRLSFQLQMQIDLNNGKEKLAYHIADGAKFRDYDFAVIDREELDTPLGEVTTAKIERTREDSDRVTYAWTAPEHNNMLVRLQQDDGSMSFTIRLEEARIDGRKLDSF